MDSVGWITAAGTSGDGGGVVVPMAAAAPAVDFDRFFRADHRAVVALALVLTGDRARAEDLAQEAFLRAYQRWDAVSRYDKPGAWVRRVVVNLASNARRSTGAEQRALARVDARPGGAGDDPARLASDADRFWAAVRSLPPQQATVVALHYLEDLAVADVAALLGIAEGTVKAHLHKARAALAPRLTDREEDVR